MTDNSVVSLSRIYISWVSWYWRIHTYCSCWREWWSSFAVIKIHLRVVQPSAVRVRRRHILEEAFRTLFCVQVPHVFEERACRRLV